jgi:peptide/nickel transport system ATP-binding protein
MSQESLVTVKDLVVRFYTYEGVVEALDGVNLTVRPGEILGLVGETGCGKSVTSLAILMIVPPPGRIESGEIFFNKEGKDQDILAQNEAYLRGLRGKDISMVFQEPRAYLNPVYTVEDQISEVLLVHRREEFLSRALETLQKRALQKQSAKEKKVEGKPTQVKEKTRKPPKTFEMNVYGRMVKRPRSPSTRFLARFSRKRAFSMEVRKEVIRLLKDVEIPDPGRVAKMYPHELSGGMAQRVVIAMALACNPSMLIADEATTNVDVTVQAQILSLIKLLKKNFNSAILYITHDLGVVAQICDRVAVMYAGSVVETAGVYETFKTPLHPYTRALLESIPRPGVEFKSIPGIVPSLINPPKACRFNERCSFAMEICTQIKPPFIEVEKDHFVACYLYGGSK